MRYLNITTLYIIFSTICCINTRTRGISEKGTKNNRTSIKINSISQQKPEIKDVYITQDQRYRVEFGEKVAKVYDRHEDHLIGEYPYNKRPTSKNSMIFFEKEGCRPHVSVGGIKGGMMIEHTTVEIKSGGDVSVKKYPVEGSEEIEKMETRVRDLYSTIHNLRNQINRSTNQTYLLSQLKSNISEHNSLIAELKEIADNEQIKIEEIHQLLQDPYVYYENYSTGLLDYRIIQKIIKLKSQVRKEEFKEYLKKYHKIPTLDLKHSMFMQAYYEVLIKGFGKIFMKKYEEAQALKKEEEEQRKKDEEARKKREEERKKEEERKRKEEKDKRKERVKREKARNEEMYEELDEEMKLKFVTSLGTSILAGVCGSSSYGALGVGIYTGIVTIGASIAKYYLGDKAAKIEKYVNKKVSSGIQYLSRGYVNKEQSDKIAKGLTTAVEYGINFLASYKLSKFIAGRWNGVGKSPRIPFVKKKTIDKVSQTQAESVAKAVRGKLTKLNNGYKIKTGSSKKPLVIRLMNKGSGNRQNAYFRISKNGKGAYNKSGNISDCRIETHIDINKDTLIEDIKNVVKNIQT